MKILKNNILKFFILVTALIAVGYFLIQKYWQPSELSKLAMDIDRQVELTKNGISGHVFFNSIINSIIIISPPYSDLKDILNGIDNNVFEELQEKVNNDETGHLFMIQKDKIIDHHLLSFSVSPVLSKAQGKSFVFTITKNETSGRPIRIEMRNLD